MSPHAVYRALDSVVGDTLNSTPRSPRLSAVPFPRCPGPNYGPTPLASQCRCALA